MEEFDTNGCGGKGSIIKPPLHRFFEASCNKHDISYSIGGSEARRFECDAKFGVMMIKDTFKIESKVTRLFYQLWALNYFVAVRLFGKKYFNYK